MPSIGRKLISFILGHASVFSVSISKVYLTEDFQTQPQYGLILILDFNYITVVYNTNILFLNIWNQHIKFQLNEYKFMNTSLPSAKQSYDFNGQCNSTGTDCCKNATMHIVTPRKALGRKTKDVPLAPALGAAYNRAGKFLRSMQGLGKGRGGAKWRRVVMVAGVGRSGWWVRITI